MKRFQRATAEKKKKKKRHRIPGQKKKRACFVLILEIAGYFVFLGISEEI